MPDATLPPDWIALHGAAWARGWSLDAGSMGYRAGWRYTATRGPQRRTWETAAAVQAWITKGCAPLEPVQLRLWMSDEWNAAA